MILESVRLHPRSPVPLYAQLRQVLVEEISQLAPGDRLPSELEMMARFEISRATVRQAIAELEADGKVERRRGFGTFVSRSHGTAWQIQSERGWYEDLTKRGHKIETRILHQALDESPAWVCEALDLPRSRVFSIRIDRLRSIDGHVATFVRNYLHPTLCEPALAADLTDASLYAWLEEHCGLRVAGGTRIVQAVAAEREFAGLIGVRKGAPLLRIEAVSLDSDQRPFECYEAWHKAEHTSISIVLTSQPESEEPPSKRRAARSSKRGPTRV